MKVVVIIIVLAVIGFFVKARLDKVNPAVIEHPVYAEMRVDAKEGSRELNIALFAKAVDLDDCNLRAEKTWSKVLSGCPSCVMSPVKCTNELPARYARLFENVAIPSTYLALTRGSRLERDGRMVVYGLTRDEGLAVCEQMRTSIGKDVYTGTLQCIAASE
jgi:hypothetical protein